jgi:hypothetical protein
MSGLSAAVRTGLNQASAIRGFQLTQATVFSKDDPQEQFEGVIGNRTLAIVERRQYRDSILTRLKQDDCDASSPILT